MHIHILGVCGTFMGSLAQLAKAAGYRVSGCDANVYPPMSTQLEQADIDIIEGYDPAQLDPAPDLIVVGNALSRGNPCVEAMLNQGIPYTSGPQWLGENFLKDRWVLAVAGTHGKTTTASMLAWILEYAGYQPGFLIGGVPKNFDVSARSGGSPFFVVEADEYDSAFFDKRSKFVHYHPRTLTLNNLEYDHADIFADLAAIQTQFHHLVRTVPGNGRIITPAADNNLEHVLAKGCWSEVEKTGADQNWQVNLINSDATRFSVSMDGVDQGVVQWRHTGRYNADNALMAIAAARHVGVEPKNACEALCHFEGVKRRMEKLTDINGVHVYDDFAHHPTAIAATLQGLREQVGRENIVAVIEPRSNTMKMGKHNSELAESVAAASWVLWYQPPDIEWSLASVVSGSPVPAQAVESLDELIDLTLQVVGDNAHIVVMSNGGFGGFHGKLIAALEERVGSRKSEVGS